MEKYVCVVCGWVYDEAVEGVKFEDQPADYNKGRTVNFKNTIIIMTSNMGSQMIQQKLAQSDTMRTDLSCKR